MVAAWLVLELEGNDVFEFLRLLRNASAAQVSACSSAFSLSMALVHSEIPRDAHLTYNSVHKFPSTYYPLQAKSYFLSTQTLLAVFEILYISESFCKDHPLVRKIYGACMLGGDRSGFSTT